MPRPEPKTITFTIDGLEVQAPENAMLVDAAKGGDVEIPVFCYEPKLGHPVGAEAVIDRRALCCQRERRQRSDMGTQRRRPVLGQRSRQ